MASTSGAPLDVLLQFARRLHERFPGRTPVEILEQIDDQLGEIKRLRDTLSARNGADTPAMLALRRQAASAYQRADIDKADEIFDRLEGLRATARASRLASEKTADEKSRAQQVIDMTTHASVLAAGANFDRSIAKLREALALAPYPTAVAAVEGMLESHLTLKATNDRDLPAAREALGIAMKWRATWPPEDERSPNWYFLQLEISKKAMLVAEIDRSEESLNASVTEARTLLTGCSKAAALPPLPPSEKRYFDESETCTLPLVQPGVQVARDQFVLAVLRYQMAPPARLLDEAETALNETVVANQGKEGQVIRAIALMRLGFFSLIRGEQVGHPGAVDRALGYYSQALTALDGANQPGVKAWITSMMTPILIDRGQPDAALAIIGDVQKEVPRATYTTAWDGLERIRGLALFRSGRDHDDLKVIKDSIEILQDVVARTSKRDDPIAYATMENYLGDALTELFHRSPTNATFADARNAYLASSDVTWCSRYPKLSAMTLDGLGELTDLGAEAYHEPSLHIRAMRTFAAAMTVVGSQDATLWPVAAAHYGQTLLKMADHDHANAPTLIGEAFQALSEVETRLKEAGDLNTLGRMEFNTAVIYSDLATSYDDQHFRRLFLNKGLIAIRAARDHLEAAGVPDYRSRTDAMEAEIRGKAESFGVARAKPAKVDLLPYPSIPVDCTQSASGPVSNTADEGGSATATPASHP